MKSLYVKDYYLRRIYFKCQFFIILYKSLYKNSFLPIDLRLKALYKLRILGSQVSSTKISNRCLVTNRGRSVYPKFGLSRIMVREMALSGKLPGVKKRSW